MNAVPAGEAAVGADVAVAAGGAAVAADLEVDKYDASMRPPVPNLRLKEISPYKAPTKKTK